MEQQSNDPGANARAEALRMAALSEWQRTMSAAMERGSGVVVLLYERDGRPVVESMPRDRVLRMLRYLELVSGNAARVRAAARAAQDFETIVLTSAGDVVVLPAPQNNPAPKPRAA